MYTAFFVEQLFKVEGKFTLNMIERYWSREYARLVDGDASNSKGSYKQS